MLKLNRASALAGLFAIGACGFVLNLATAEESVSQKVLGQIVAVERIVAMNIGECVEKLERTPNTNYDFDCKVVKFQKADSDSIAFGDSVSAPDMSERSCWVSAYATIDGYQISVGVVSSREEAKDCLMRAFAEPSFSKTKLRSVVHTLAK